MRRDPLAPSPYAGQRFGRVTMAAGHRRVANHIREYQGHCDCGREVWLRKAVLKPDSTRGCSSCAHTPRVDVVDDGWAPVVDLSGMEYGEWRVVRFAGRDRRQNLYWHCRCSCGEERVVLGANLRHSHSLSCGHVRSADD